MISEIEGVYFARETAAQVMQEIEPLMKAHEEVLKNDITQEWPLDVDFARYRRAETNGAFRAYTARHNGKLVGYCTFFIASATQRKSLVIAHEDALYLAPEYRKMGVAKGLMNFANDGLKDVAELVIYHAPEANPRFGVLLKRAGYKKYSEYYARRL
jgi:GNAT superfamily N-acetyltransferase